MLLRNEFTYNPVVNHSTSKSPFEIVYGHILPYYLDLAKVFKSPLSSSKRENFAVTITKA